MKTVYKGSAVVTAASRKTWRNWLQKNHTTKHSCWLVIYNKKSEKRSVSYQEAVEEALCFGWIDSVANKRDEESRYQYFAQRKTNSNWSSINRERTQKMIDQQLMTQAGQALIDIARQTGTWEALTDVENGVIPPDLQKMFDRNKTAFKNFNSFSPSSRKIILGWIFSAKTQETRLTRLRQTVELAAKNIKANHYRQ